MGGLYPLSVLTILVSQQGGLVGLVDYPDDDEDDDEDEDKEDTLPLSKKAKFES